MKVILLQNIKNFGRIGDIKNVSDGYARNFLLPKNFAKSATDGNLKEAEALKQKAAAQIKIVAEKSKEFAAKLEGAVIELEKKVSESGTLFASVTKEEVASSLSKLAGGKIEEDMLDFGEHGEHIKHAGEHMIKVEFTPEVKSEVKLNVVAD